MPPKAHLLFFLLVLLLLARANAQACDQAIGETLIEDLTSLNPIYTSSTTLNSDASITTSGTSLTNTGQASTGSIFFSSPTDFQGTGGFSLKFVLQADGSGGNAWEAIIAGSSIDGNASPVLGTTSPPFSLSDSCSSGWCRQGAFVVEFDSLPLDTNDVLADGPHIAMYLHGTEICKTSISTNLYNGDKYTVWLDFDGFATAASVRLSSADDGTRPAAATLDCVVDIWGTISISSAAHVGFSAYNSDVQDGAIHKLVDSISIADGYKPYDLDDCSSYARCSPKTQSGLCTKVRTDGSTCDVVECTGGWIWDVAGSDCCAFVERTSWAVPDGTELVLGNVESCSQTRSTIAYQTTADRCL